MKHFLSKEDHIFKHQVESCQFSAADFDHKAHIRLAYIYLTENKTDQAVHLMRNTLISLLIHAGIDPSQKYHETLTAAWVLAVNHFMNRSDYCQSTNDLIENNPTLLNSKIMMTHYSAKLLFSDEARKAFIEPNLDPIPRYGQ